MRLPLPLWLTVTGSLVGCPSYEAVNTARAAQIIAGRTISSACSTVEAVSRADIIAACDVAMDVYDAHEAAVAALAALVEADAGAESILTATADVAWAAAKLKAAVERLEAIR